MYRLSAKLGRHYRRHSKGDELEQLSRLRTLVRSACQLATRSSGIARPPEYLSQKDRQTPLEGPINQRKVLVDGTAFKATQGRDHHSEGDSHQHRAAADIRLAACRSRWSVSGLREAGGKEHLEGQCTGSTEGQPQEDFLVPGTIDLKAQRSQVRLMSVP